MDFSWECICESVIGASHIRNNKELQDAYKMSSKNDCLIVAIADGHGSNRHPHSKYGAERGVNSAIDNLLEFWNNVKKESNLEEINIEQYVKDNKLIESILKSWREGVIQEYENYYQRHLFSTKDKKHGSFQSSKSNDCGESYTFENEIEFDKRDKIKEKDYYKVYTLYGSTLLAVLITENCVLQLQLGDGDIIYFNSSNELKRIFELSEVDLISNETESLCQMDAEKKFKINIKSLKKDNNLKMIFLSTDGYSNSFKTDGDFFEAIKCFYKYLLEKNGSKCIEDNLKDWLMKTSEDGSGDDITVALIYNSRCCQSIKKEGENE